MPDRDRPGAAVIVMIGVVIVAVRRGARPLVREGACVVPVDLVVRVVPLREVVDRTPVRLRRGRREADLLRLTTRPHPSPRRQRRRPSLPGEIPSPPVARKRIPERPNEVE